MKKEFKNLLEVTTYFADKKVCKDYLEKLRWEDGNITCPHCSSSKKIYRMKHNFKCSECRKQFSVTKGSIFENSPVSLQKCFVGMYLLTSHKKGISSVQLSKDLGITQKSAWYMLQRIRYILTNGVEHKLENTIEVDETYVGGKNKNRHKDKKVKGTQGRSTKDKVAVFGMLERGGVVVAMKVANVSSKELQGRIRENVGANVTSIMSDEWTAYSGLSTYYNHEQVNHGEGKYVVGDAHTNTLKGFWSILKRGIFGIYHCVSVKHIDLYIKEFEFRYNTRELGEVERFDLLLSQCNDRITYKELTKKVG